MCTTPRGAQRVLTDRKLTAAQKYRRMVVGEVSTAAFVWYELCTSLLSSWPGAVGYWLRARFYPTLFRRCGRGVIFGRNLTIRHPHRISLGHRVVLNDGVLLDAKGTMGDGILIGDDVFIGWYSVVTTTDGTLELGPGCNIGAWCRIGTYGHTRIGAKALLAAYVYIVGADHEATRTDIPIVDQPSVSRGGVEIGEGTWIGTKATVLDGTRVGAHAIIGAHALVTEPIPDYAVAVGIPAKVIKLRRAASAPAPEAPPKSSETSAYPLE